MLKQGIQLLFPHGGEVSAKPTKGASRASRTPSDPRIESGGHLPPRGRSA